MKDKSTSSFIMWVFSCFFIGIVVLLGYSLLEGIFQRFDSFENIFVRILFLTVLGGLCKYGYELFKNK